MTSFNAEMIAMLDRLGTTNDGFVVAALYKFVSLDDIDGLRQILQQLCDNNQILGTILLAEEGINGTIAAPRDGMTRFLNWLEADGRFDELSLKFSFSPDQPFLRMKVRPKREIVTMGCPEVNPAKRTGTYVDPKDWNGLIADPDVLLVDTRNSYETAIGMFAGAVDPMTTNFREFPDWAHSLANQPADRRPKKVAMYCTGGIRCEKASALMQDMGFDEVYHLKGGILNILKMSPPPTANGKASVSFLTGAWRLIMIYSPEAMICVMLAVCRYRPMIWRIPILKTALAVHIVNPTLILTAQRVLPNGKNKCDLPPNAAKRILA